MRGATSQVTLPLAVIFDFDGVLVDTEPLHYEAFQRVLEPLGLGFSWDEYGRTYIGFDDRGVFRAVFASAGRTLDDALERRLIVDKGRAFTELVRVAGPRLRPLPGVLDWLHALKGAVPVGLCTGALPDDVEPILESLGLSDAFDVRVTAADVERSKPDPASYRLTLQRLAAIRPEVVLAADRCVAIEDTEAGVASALGAGLRVVHVKPGAGAGIEGRVWLTPSLEAITPEQLGIWCWS